MKKGTQKVPFFIYAFFNYFSVIFVFIVKSNINMESIKGTRTEQNLLKAFAGESQAKNRYEFFAKVAKAEGLEQIAALFMETAENERSHAKQFFKQLEGWCCRYNT